VHWGSALYLRPVSTAAVMSCTDVKDSRKMLPRGVLHAAVVLQSNW
jgi:hypothetical protein